MSYDSQVMSPILPLTSLKRKLNLKAQSPASRMLERELKNSQNTASKSTDMRQAELTPSAGDSQDSKRIVGDLLKQLNVEVQKRQKVEAELQEWKERLVRKEIEFREIISRYQQEKVQSVQLLRVINHSSLKAIHDDIQDKVERSNLESEKWLEGKYKENLSLMERKLKIIKQHMDEELAKHKKLSADSYTEIMMEVEATKDLAKTIDEENRRLTKEVKETKFKNDLLVEERGILIQELIEKKTIVKQLLAEKQRPTSHMPAQLVSRFIGEPSISSPKRSSQRSIDPMAQSSCLDDFRVHQASRQTINCLQRTLSRQKKKTRDISTLFAWTNKKNEQLNNILWSCINQAKRQAEQCKDESFATKLVDNLAKSEKLIQSITELHSTVPDGSMKSPFYSHNRTIDASILLQEDC